MSAESLSTLAAFLATTLSIGAPGLLAVRLLGLGATPLERFSLAVAVGRLLFAAASFALAAAGGAVLLPVLVAGCVLALLGLRDRAQPRKPGDPRDALAVLVPVAAACLLVGLVVFRSGGLDPAGDLVFYGKDAVNDPLLYSATSGMLLDRGLPLVSPFAADSDRIGHVLFFGALAGLRVVAASILLVLPGASPEALLLAPFALVFRALPLLDVASLGVAAFALARALGARPAGASLAGLLVVLGGEAWAIARMAVSLVGFDAQDLLGWAFFGPLLTPVNPVASAVQTLFAAALLLARMPAQPVRAAVLAGLLVAATSEIKFFGWAPALGGLVLAALLRPPAAVARGARTAALAAVAFSLPSLVEKLAFARGLGDRLTVGFALCPTCLPRYLTEASLGGHDPSFQIFETFRARDLLDPGFLASAVLSLLFFLAVVLGARLLALPALLRGVRATEPGPALVHRFLLWMALVGLALAVGVASGPHHLNAGQFAWPALFGLSLELGLAVEAAWQRRRFAFVALALVAAFASPGWTLLRMGAGAPILLRVRPPERALMAALAARAAPDDVVLEPSWLQHPDYPAPAAWLAERQVLLSTDAAAAYLPSYERLFRHDQIRRVFTSSDRAAALRAIEASGARWIYAPSSWPLRFTPGPELETVLANEAGTLYRVSGG